MDSMLHFSQLLFVSLFVHQYILTHLTQKLLPVSQEMLNNVSHKHYYDKNYTGF